MREFIGEGIKIDGRRIPYRLITASNYFEAKEYSEVEIDTFFEDGIGDLVNQIMGLKQSCYLLDHTSYSCQSLTDNLYGLKIRLIQELKEIHSFQFDEDFVENFGK